MSDKKKSDNIPLVPGIGVGGMVMCPFGFQRMPCLKQGCELWVELYYDKKKVGRCALAYNAIVSTEITHQLKVLNEKLKPSVENPV